MNRRSFVLSIALSACSATPPDRRRRKTSPPDARPSVVIGDYGFILYPEREWRGHMDVHGDRLANAHQDGIAIWDTVAMKQLAVYAHDEQSFCFLRDGTLAIFVVPDGSDHCVIYRIDAAGKLRTVYGPYYIDVGEILASPRDDEYYVLDRRQVRIFTETRGRAEGTARIQLPHGSGTNQSLVRSLGDGRVLASDGQFRLLSRDGTTTTYKARRSPVHVAMISDAQLWYSYAELGAERVARITRFDFGAPSAAAPTIELDKEHVLYLACAPSGSFAALVFWVDYEAERQQGLNWEVIAYSPDGTERWRKAVLQSGDIEALELNKTLDIAMTEQRVIFRGKHGQLTAWEAATGNLVPLG